MAGYAPTCSTCGAVMTGYAWSEELNFMVHFCPRCQAKGETRRWEATREPVQKEALEKAA